MNTIREQIKARALELAQRAQGLRIYKFRMAEDDGWYYFTAPSLAKARKKYPREKVTSASQTDAYGIAVRALEGA